MHVASQPLTPQKESTSQIVRTHGSQACASGSPTAHSECAQEVGPQSAEQVAEVSFALQKPLPHEELHAPQSALQVAQLSPRKELHLPLPHTSGHGPQSSVQVEHVSTGSLQRPSPQPARQAPQSAVQLPQLSPTQ